MASSGSTRCNGVIVPAKHQPTLLEGRYAGSLACLWSKARLPSENVSNGTLSPTPVDTPLALGDEIPKGELTTKHNIIAYLSLLAQGFSSWCKGLAAKLAS